MRQGRLKTHLVKEEEEQEEEDQVVMEEEGVGKGDLKHTL